MALMATKPECIKHLEAIPNLYPYLLALVATVGVHGALPPIGESDVRDSFDELVTSIGWVGGV